MLINDSPLLDWAHPTTRQSCFSDRLLEERRRNRRMAREYLRALEKIAAEFLAQGVKLSTEMLEVQKVLLTAQLDAEDEEESQRG